ncbi:MAG: NeuB family member [Methanomicrobiales archaeon 53_19]|uniref:N-acetylneuraminate synthase family protein n=1 Tax=Methanocalculus sp. TaxID=2004547 RepID=UPI00074A4BAD|nr:N-acetylneuraminate synthase family protein [Methanocalculus sp.]KUK70523.1 MAG: NeuB family member [Methanocalculus sp. 52_23]KUL02971.1 MAG: NeuB family member [Methanomicrobiales archaeon 53_19]HIJ05696.1 acetylneuraminic acid synthetase [Methanocalculus sp.]
MKPLEFDRYVISERSRPFVIAEIGVNYYDVAKEKKIDPLDAAKMMVAAAAESGADAVKFQTYKADNLASKYSPAYWDTTKERTQSQYELFKKFDSFGEDEYQELARFSKKQQVIFLSTPFDFEAVDTLDDLMPIFKVSSSDITNTPFIQYIAKKQKPIFLSTGASTIDEIDHALKTIKNEGNDQIAIMHCILNYPTAYQDANLGMISHLKSLYPDYLMGYSDHTLPDSQMFVLTTAVLLGAQVIEKHFTLNKTLPGNDHYHAMDPEDLRRFILNLDFLQDILGNSEKTPLESEMPSRMYARRSIVAKRKIPKGARISEDMVTFKRPGTGIEPSKIGTIIGKIALKTIKEDEIIDLKTIN